MPLGFAGLYFYNWAAEWWAGVTLLVAALGLWLGRWWSDLVAIAASAPFMEALVISETKKSLSDYAPGPASARASST